MIDYLTFIKELKELKPVVVSEHTHEINKLIKKYETIITEHEKEENNEPSRT